LQIQCSQLRDATECLSVDKNATLTDDFCPTTFHSYFCSPETPFDHEAEIKCPFYILKFFDPKWPSHHFRGYEELNDKFAALRTKHTCDSLRPYPHWGKFSRDPCEVAVKEHNETYFNMLKCKNEDCSIRSYNGTDVIGKDEEKDFEVRMLHYARMIMISGYAVSLVATTLGSILMIGLRRLRCTRIWIHINLQLSFLLRAAIWLLHDASTVDTTLSSDSNFEMTTKMEAYFQRNNYTINTNDTFTEVTTYLQGTWLHPMKKYHTDNLGQFTEVYDVFCNDESGWFWCRLYDVISHYILCTNYFWVLVEGIYLRMLLQRAQFGFSMGNMSVFMVIGWGMAFLPTFVWLIVNMALRNDVNCWANDQDLAKSSVNSFGKTYRYELITEIPIMISVLVNVFIFISVVSIVGSKLRVNVMKKSDYRYRLARSTLALLPLLGIHYALTMFIKVGAAESKTQLHIVTNFINATLTSLQGLLVSIIYCFCNAEVQDELEKTYSAWKLGRDVRDDANRRRSTLSNSQNGGFPWPQRRASSMFMNRASFSFAVPATRRSTEATYLPSESLLSTGRSASIAGPGATSTSTMRRIKQIIMNNNEQRGNSGPPRSSLLSVPNTYDEEVSPTPFVPCSSGQQLTAPAPPQPPPPPSYPHPSVSIMSGIAEENDEAEEKRREGVVTRPSVSPSTVPEPARQPSENDDSGYDEKPNN